MVRVPQNVKALCELIKHVERSGVRPCNLFVNVESFHILDLVAEGRPLNEKCLVPR